jgi:ribonuclease HII
MDKLKKYFEKGKIEVGCDEAGRGCLAGPVVAAAVILKKGKNHPLLNDSKKVSKSNREILRVWIEENAINWAVGIVSNQEIDEINILNASFLAMHRAIDKLKVPFDQLLIDGNRFTPYGNVSHHCIIKGDSKFLSIAAASIIAKTHRDQIMENLDEKYPGYFWKKNQGYPTKQHRNSIITLGTTPYHRLTFKLIPSNAE